MRRRIKMSSGMQETIITSQKSWRELFTELWDYKEIFLFLGWRDILVHYKQTVIGIAWVILRPLLTVVIFTIIFSRIAGIASSVAPYPLLVFSAMLVWQFFVDMLTYASMSFIANQALVSKVYFPRIMLPTSRIICSSLDFVVAFFFYLALSIVRYGCVPPLQFFLLPIFFLWMVVVSSSVSLLLASLIVRYRDFKHVLPFITQLGLYCTPIGFSLSMVPHSMMVFLGINPLVGVINGFRWCLVNEPLQMGTLMVSASMTCVLTAISMWYFKQSQDTFADVV